MGTQFNRTAVYVSLGLAIALVVGVIWGAKFVFTNLDRAPVAITAIPSEDSESPECAALVASLPEKFMGHPAAEVAEPRPAGTAAWATFSDEPVTLRCGVEMPFQYTDYSVLEDIDGASWLRVVDMTPGSDLTTWYTADRAPAVAVTTHDDAAPKGLDLSALREQEQPTHPAPLTDLEAAEGTAAAAQKVCAPLLEALPEELPEGYQRATDGPTAPRDENTAVWTATGREAIALRCGVAPPPGYQAGEQIQQINAIPWFEDTTLASGTTASTWFALGRDTDIAVHVPQDVAADALVELGEVIAETVPEQ